MTIYTQKIHNDLLAVIKDKVNNGIISQSDIISVFCPPYLQDEIRCRNNRKKIFMDNKSYIVNKIEFGGLVCLKKMQKKYQKNNGLDKTY